MVSAMRRAVIKKETTSFCRRRQLFANSIRHCLCKKDRKSLKWVGEKKAKSQHAGWKTVSAKEIRKELTLLKLQF